MTDVERRVNEVVWSAGGKSFALAISFDSFEEPFDHLGVSKELPVADFSTTELRDEP